MKKQGPLFAGLEGGGTKFVCAVATGPEDIRAQESFPTTTPEETIGKAISFLKRHEPFAALGIASFGPCDLDPRSPAYGHITSTPKAGWENVNLLGIFRREFPVPVGFDTDVNVAALGEWKWGAGRGLDTVLYLTVGTGIGGGGVINGRMLHGLIHPEMGHIRVPRVADDTFAGNCPYHGDCLQGLAAGPAIEARWGKPAEELPPDHPAWSLEAAYLALAVNDLICVLSPQRIILGGGVMYQRHLFPLIRQKVKRLLNGYIQSPLILERIEEFIVPPGLGDRSGVLGAIALAEQTREKTKG
ncbi:MAG: ROK family protein [Deltaproteobacteria bacterium]|nr:ROK family protein [Deltaproteobacteria bacterium]